ncbi:MAG: hypothetical protein ACIALR_04215, partial [Blastopirellula sp. JB062]
MDEHASYNRLLTTLEAWPRMTLPALATYRRLWDALDHAPGSIEIAVTHDYGKFHLSQQSLRRALERLEELGLVTRELTYEDDGVKTTRIAVRDALAVHADRCGRPIATLKVTTAPVAALKIAPQTDPAPESAQIPAADP